MVVAQPLPYPSPPSLLLLTLSLSLPLSPSLSSRPFLRSSLADRTNEPLLIRRLLLLLRLLLLVSFLSSFSRQFTSASKYSQRLKTGQQKRREPRFSIFPRQEFDARAPITSVFPAWYRVSREYRAACERRIFYQLRRESSRSGYSLVFQNERVQSSVKVSVRPPFEL